MFSFLCFANLYVYALIIPYNVGTYLILLRHVNDNIEVHFFH